MHMLQLAWKLVLISSESSQHHRNVVSYKHITYDYTKSEPDQDIWD